VSNYYKSLFFHIVWSKKEKIPYIINQEEHHKVVGFEKELDFFCEILIYIQTYWSPLGRRLMESLGRTVLMPQDREPQGQGF